MKLPTKSAKYCLVFTKLSIRPTLLYLPITKGCSAKIKQPLVEIFFDFILMKQHPIKK
ncbi:MAG: hypothetical protein LBL74_02420 [Bacteroidales bacterium]|nr:hypothetical protein [Bacteroidales bacterium]